MGLMRRIIGNNLLRRVVCMDLRGCMEVSGDLKYFNGTEWKEIRKYKDKEEILICKEDGSYVMELPSAYIVRDTEDPFYMYKDSKGCYPLMTQTGTHDMILAKDSDGKKVFVRYKTGSLLSKESSFLQLLNLDCCELDRLEDIKNSLPAYFTLEKDGFTKCDLLDGKYGFCTSSGMVVLSSADSVFVTGSYYLED